MIYFISSYPERGLIHGKKTVGVASYTKNLILNIKKSILKIKIFAETFEFTKKEKTFEDIFENRGKYIEDNVEVERIWKRNNLKSIIKTFFKIPKNSTLLIPIEFYMFGGIIEMISALLCMFFLKTTKKVRVISIVHQVVENFDNIEKSKLTSFIKNNLVKIYYFLISISSNKIVVFEEYFQKSFNKKKVIVIPHAIEETNFDIQKKDVKFASNLLYFGFISPYKGVDDLLNKYTDDCGKLAICGGANPNHIKNKEYHQFIKKIFDRFEKEMIFPTGFVKENEIPYKFINTNIVVLPYRNFFSSSGPLSLAFTYEKPFILSYPLSKYFDSKDFKEALKETNLTKEIFLFDFLDKESKLNEKIEEINKNKKNIIEFIKIIKEKRSWQNIAKEYLKLI